MNSPGWTISSNFIPITKPKFPSDHATCCDVLQAAISILLPALCDLSSQHCSTQTKAAIELEQCSLTKLALATAAGFGSANCLCTIKFIIFHLFRSSWPEKFNISQPSGHYMYRQFNVQQLHVLPTQCICVLRGSENKQRLFPYTALTDWFVYQRRSSFAANRTLHHLDKALMTDCKHRHSENFYSLESFWQSYIGWAHR